MTKFKNSTCDKKKIKIKKKIKKNSKCGNTLKLKLRQNSKTQIWTNLKKPKLGKKKNCYKTAKLKLRQNSKNSNSDTTQKTQIVTKLKMGQNSPPQIVTKFKKSYCDKTPKLNCDKTQKLKLRPNLKINCNKI